MKQVHIRVKPRAAKNAVLGEREGYLEVAVTAPPADGAANTAVVKLLAAHFGVPKSRIRITRGQSARIKTVTIAD
ncbi:MAG: DUF167 domain-containing protein [Actinomycetes bacterium]|jgi:uncharacterized protein (TIGR00251 family)|nr:DUF167 domain-containing protein [Actinomycetes bacterium]